MSAAEKPPNLADLDPRYPMILEYLERGAVVVKLYGLRPESTPQRPVCWCKKGAKCDGPGKHPRGTWKDPETGTAYVRSAAEVQRAFPPGGAWNVGLTFSAGWFEGCAAIDVDSEQARLGLLERHGLDVRAALCAQETGNGRHAIYRIPPELLGELRNGADVFDVPGVDIRVGTGLIVVEPSIHYSGKPYRWERLGEPEDAPAGVLSLLRSRKSTSPEPAAPERKPSATAPALSADVVLLDARKLEKRAARATEEAAARIAQALPGSRHATNVGQARSLGFILALRPDDEQRLGLEALLEAFERQARTEDDAGTEWAGDERKGIRQRFVEGVNTGRASGGKADEWEPIPANPEREPRPQSSSTADSSSSEESAEKETAEQAAFTPRVVLTRLSDIGPPLPVEWLPSAIADRRIPLGELSIIMGVPGIGKGSITAQIVAELTQAGHAVIVSAPEDDLHRVTLPRYMAAGADLKKVYAAAFEWAPDEESPVSIAEHYAQLLKLSGEAGGVAIILDPYEEHLTADVKNEQANRQALRPLLSGAREQRVAVLGIDHPNRGTATDAYLRAGGNSAKYKLARSVLIAARQGSSDTSSPSVEPSSSSELVLIHAKSNLGKLTVGLRFAIHTEVVIGEGGAPVETARAELIGETTLTAEEVLGEGAQEQAASVAAAAEWLEAHLTEHGLGMIAEEVEKAAKTLNDEWTRPVLKLAVKRLGGKYAALGMGGRWGYRLEGYRPLGEDRP